MNFSLSQSLGGLFSCSAKNEFSSRCMHIGGKLLQCLKPRGIYASHVSEPENNDGGRSDRRETITSSLCVAPNRKGPWTLKMLTYLGISLCCK